MAFGSVSWKAERPYHISMAAGDFAGSSLGDTTLLRGRSEDGSGEDEELELNLESLDAAMSQVGHTQRQWKFAQTAHHGPGSALAALDPSLQADTRAALARAEKLQASKRHDRITSQKRGGR
jgi:hypothetical protein